MNNNYILDFFDTNKPCPSFVTNCEQLRAEYLQELKDNTTGQCSTCFARIVRDKYIDIILKSNNAS